MDLNTIKNDLLNKLSNDLYMAEIELERIVKDTYISYNIQLSRIEETLESIILINTKISALNSYFKTAEQVKETEE